MRIHIPLSSLSKTQKEQIYRIAWMGTYAWMGIYPCTVHTATTPVKPCSQFPWLRRASIRQRAQSADV